MDEHGGDQYNFDLNLDFLDSSSTTTTQKSSTIITEYQNQTQTQPTFDIELLANRIATVNDMTIQLKAIKDENTRLQKQMQDFRETALSIQNMYEQEKAERLKFAKLSHELQEKCEQTESQLTNKSLHFDQIESRLQLEAADKKPIPYNDLALKYQRLALQLEEEKQLHSKEKVTLQLIKEHLELKKLSPLPVLKKKSSQSHSKVKSRDFSMQCNFKVEVKSKETQASLGYCNEEPKDTCTQGTQYTWYTTTRGTNTHALNSPQKELRTQGTQYISSTTTRGTSTATFIKTHCVGTNFPEPGPSVSIEDIFKEMIFDVSPLSPMLASPPAEMKEEKPEMKSVATNTGLKNVRKPIDYVVANIKTSDSRPPSRDNLYDRVKNETPLMGGMPTMNPFAGLGMAPPPMHSTVAELWNMLGHTIFALLQQNGGAAPPALNPMQMNVVNDRMRNLSGGGSRRSEQQQRNCESQSGNNSFDHEYSRDFATTTRSAATSPNIPLEFGSTQPYTRPSFVPVNSPNIPVEIKKIVLNNSFPEPVVSSSKKSSKVDEILQLFPEYSDSFKKRKAIKRLLKSSNINKKPKRERNESFSSRSVTASPQLALETRIKSLSSVQESPQPAMEIAHKNPAPPSNWKTEIFGDSYSDSSLDSTVMDYISTHSHEEEPPEQKWIQPKSNNLPSSNDDVKWSNTTASQSSQEEECELKWTQAKTNPPYNDFKWPICNSTLEMKPPVPVRSPLEEEFLGFDEETNHSSFSDEVFCKPFLPPKRHQPTLAANLSFPGIQQKSKGNSISSGCRVNTKTEPIDDASSAKAENPKRKRRSKKTEANQTNKMFKVDQSSTYPEPGTSTKPVVQQKRSLNLNKIKPKENEASTNPLYKPKRSLSLNRIKAPKQEPKPKQVQASQAPQKPSNFVKPEWMKINDNPVDEDQPIPVTRNHHGPMVMKVEKPPDSIFQDLKTCFTNQQQQRDMKPFIGPILPSQTALQENYVLPQQTTQFMLTKKDESLRFPFKNEQSTTNTHGLTNQNYNESTPPQQHTAERQSRSSITILKEELISESHDVKAAKQEIPINVVRNDANLLEQNKAFDLDNMPIYFVSDQNSLYNSKPIEEQLPMTVATRQRESSSHCENPKVSLPGFSEIRQGLKVETPQTIITPDRTIQEQNGMSVQFSRLPVIVKSNPPIFFRNPNFKNTLESSTIVNDVKPTATELHKKSSYLVLNHQNLLNSSALAIASTQESLNVGAMEQISCEEPKVVATGTTFCDQESLDMNGTDNQRQEKPQNNTWFIDKSSTLTCKDDKDTKDQTWNNKEQKPSILILPNQSSFDDTSCSKQEESDVAKVTAQPSPSEFSFQSNALNISGIESHNQMSPIQEENPRKSPASIVGKINKHELSSPYSSDSEGDLSIDFPPSPTPNNCSSLDLSAILKTPEKAPNAPELQFKTPDICEKNNTSAIAKALTSSTEKLVEDYLLNEVPGSEGPKFQVFLDRILNEVAPPSSPISVLASSEKQNYSETESSCDDEDEEGSATQMTSNKKCKRKAAATAALAIKRSARIKAKAVEANSMVNSLYAMTIPTVQLGKYTKKVTVLKKTEIDETVAPVKEEKTDIRMGFFQPADDEEDDDDEPLCQPIRRHSVEESNTADGECEPNVKEIPKSNPFYSISPLRESEFGTVLNSANISFSQINEQTFSETPSMYQTSDDSYSPQSPPVESFRNSFAKTEESLSHCFESPASPPMPDQTASEMHTIPESFETSSETTGPTNSNTSCKTIVSYLIANYNPKHHEMLTKTPKPSKKNNLPEQLRLYIDEFVKGFCLIMDTVRLVESILKLTRDEKPIAKAIVEIIKIAPRPETEVTVPIPDTYLGQTHRKILTLLEHLKLHLPNLQSNLQTTIEQSMFNLKKEMIPIEVLMNLTQFYLQVIANPIGGTNPARLFICKCLYFFNQKAIPMIYQTLCVYPTVLPQRSDVSYDRSDVLISTIQSILMSTYYDPEKCDFMTRQILAKLRKFYNYESFKPPRDEVIENMIAKIRAGRFKNVPYAFSLICKRMEQNQTEKYILKERLMPLANEFYHTLSQNSENDEKIACVLECISFVIKPFSIGTDISQYVNLFGRFLNAATESKVIQEAAVAAILRTVRFGYVQCFNAIYNFNPTYELSETLMAMLRSFVYKKGKSFLEALEQQTQELVAL